MYTLFNSYIRSICPRIWVGLTYIFDVPPSCPSTQPFLPNSKLPKSNRADSGTTNIKDNPTQVQANGPPCSASRQHAKGSKNGKENNPKNCQKIAQIIFLLLNCVPGRRPSKPPPRPSRSSVSGPRPSPLSRPPFPPPRCPRRCFPSPGAQFKRQNFSFIFSLNIGLSFGLRFPSLEKGPKRVEFVVSLDT